VQPAASRGWSPKFTWSMDVCKFHDVLAGACRHRCCVCAGLMLRRLLVLVPFVVLGLASTGCGPRVKVSDARGPDGSNDWKRITCKRMDKKCFSAARALCPNGYIFTKSGASVSSRANTLSSQGGVGVKTLPHESEWGTAMYSKKPGTLMVLCAESSNAVAIGNHDEDHESAAAGY
jgi:hypothetical protein